jgi:mRNA interferase MazF
MSMITTSRLETWPGDVKVEDLDQAGLSRPCIVRLKLFTLDNRLIIRRAGRLSARDRRAVTQSLDRSIQVG